MQTNTTNNVLIFGTFDLLHPGHIFLLQQARTHGYVTAIVARDATVKKYKHTTCYHDEATRLTNLNALGLVDARLGYIDTPYQVLDDVKPNVIILGHDQTIFVDALETELSKRNLNTTKIIRAKALNKPTLFSSRQLKRALTTPDSGFVCINKPTGMTSHDVVAILRKQYNTKRVGHAGTLDPLATGVLICGINGATKLLDWWHIFPKTYTATLEFGKTADTYDSDGVVTTCTKAIKPTKKQILAGLESFKGIIEQIPPLYSAKKIQGQKAYALARAGKTVKLKPQTVMIHSITLDDYTYPTATITITCSTGTYIRSIIHDLGQQLKTGAIMTGLNRTAIGPISLDSTRNLDESADLYSVEAFQKSLNEWYMKKAS